MDKYWKFEHFIDTLPNNTLCFGKVGTAFSRFQGLIYVQHDTHKIFPSF